ncbi:MAG: hypothetical protein MJZ76_01900 [Bacteroidales bacterium]|nr:hypothetical protein [Bacteroidales bacterium]
MRKIIVILFFVAVCTGSLQAQFKTEVLADTSEICLVVKSATPTLKLNEEISSDKVVRLVIKKCKKCDSLPDFVFSFPNLRELVCSRCNLKVFNKQIAQLSKIRLLDVSGNKLVRLPEEIGQLKDLQTLIINRNKIESLPETIGELRKLEMIDAWDNPLYVLPKSISKLAKTLKLIDLRQIPLRANEFDDMEKLLPKTDIKVTSVCECENDRD